MVAMVPPPKNWTEVIARGAEQLMTATVCFYRATDESDPDKSFLENLAEGVGVEVIWAGPARVQHIRAPQAAGTDYQASSSRSFRFQTKRDSGMPFIPAGAMSRVLDAGELGDADLELLEFSVLSSINASTQAVKTTELLSNMRPIDWDWKLNEDGMVVPA